MGMAEASKEFATVVLPPHIGAVFTEGKNIAYAVDRFGRLIPGIETYSISDEGERDAWILENLRVFNSLPTAPDVWKGAVDDYLLDYDTAVNNVLKETVREGDRKALEKETSESREKLLAMMAVSASARAMEHSSGVPTAYLTYITRSRDGEDLDVQDRWKEYLLHKDPKKYLAVINDPLVRHYYDRILKDAGIKTGKDLDWHKPKGDPWRCSRVELVEEAATLRSEGTKDRPGDEEKDAPLLYFLHGKGRNGHLDAYIKKVLLVNDSESFVVEQYGRSIDDTARYSAARIACDAFLVDKYTRWEYQLTNIRDDGTHAWETEIYDKNLNLAPSKSWGGDPFRAVIQPTFLPRLKGVYSGEAKEILDLVDMAYRPHDIFFDPKNPELQWEILHPTAVEHLKRYAKYNIALFLFFGGSRAQAVAEGQVRALENNLMVIGDRLDEIYGSIKIDDKDPNDRTGKHIVGAQEARILYAKARAARASVVNPNFFEEAFGPTVDPRSPAPFRELREHLFGPTLNWKNGLIANLSSARTGFIFQGNDYHAEEFIVKANKLLAGAEGSKARQLLKAAVVVSTAMTSKR